MLKRRLILLILASIGLLSTMSIVSLLLYFDPYTYKNIAVFLLVICFSACTTSFSTLLLYFIKKIYYRGDVGMYHIFTSLRQSFLLTLLIIGVIIIISIGIPVLLPIILLVSLIVFFELFVQSF